MKYIKILCIFVTGVRIGTLRPLCVYAIELKGTVSDTHDALFTNAVFVQFIS